MIQLLIRLHRPGLPQTKNMKKTGWLLFAVLMTGCSTLRITTSWKAEGSTARRYDKILVLGLISEPDRSLRQKMEQHLADDMRQLGYHVVCATDAFGPKAFEGMKEEEAIRELRNKGITAVATIVLLDKEKEKYYVPEQVHNQPYLYRDRFWHYYSAMHDRVYTSGYYSDTKYFWESNFYDLGNQPTLLYSARSHSFDAESAESLAHTYGRAIVKDMVKNLVLQSQPQPAKAF